VLYSVIDKGGQAEKEEKEEGEVEEKAEIR
jgi:hypothetical protein